MSNNISEAINSLTSAAMTLEEIGVVVAYKGDNPELRGFVWGIVYENDIPITYGWVNPVNTKAVKISSPERLIKPEDAAPKGSQYTAELKKNGKVVTITRTVTAKLQE